MTQRSILEPALPAAATGLMPVTQLRLRALARRELLQRTFTGTFVYPVGWLVVAGVTGAGQILAGGDAHQVITGANVTNGNTNNATLTIGNVRVGATTFDYQVGNAGTTGPALRGAIQTAVNGGNISDARLSGAGVTASNYNAGGPGGNSGNLGVTFTAASAGALAPLSGQAINLRSNFRITRECFPQLLASRGVVCNIASTLGLVGYRRQAVYSMAKAGVIGLTRNLAADYADRGIRVNAIAPGIIATPQTAGRLNTAGFYANIVGTTPMGRPVVPEV